MLRQLDPVTVVCGAVVVLGFLALGVLKWAEHPHWPGFAGSGGEDDGDRDSQPFVPQFPPPQNSDRDRHPLNAGIEILRRMAVISGSCLLQSGRNG